MQICLPASVLAHAIEKQQQQQQQTKSTSTPTAVDFLLTILFFVFSSILPTKQIKLFACATKSICVYQIVALHK